MSQYLFLLKRFLANEMSAPEFQATYLGMFKHEQRQLDPSLFSILDTLFGEVDSFVPDSELRAELESQNPGFYLDEVTLRHKVFVAYHKLGGNSALSSMKASFVLAGATWEHYEMELAIRCEKSVPRLAYLEGALELMRPSRDHERITSYLGRLIEVYAEHADIELSPYRSWTLKTGRTAGGEPDECYIVGADQSKDRPDLVIEVIWTSGGIDKLEIYQRLGIDEVWFWLSGRLEVHSLRGGTYERAARSRWPPGLDLDLMGSFLDRRSAHIAKRDFREALRSAK